MADIKTNSIALLHDRRVNCYSIMAIVKVGAYLQLAEYAYGQRGGIEGQRDRLRTTSAIRIRRRMVEDLIAGAVIPPITVGVVIPESDLKNIDAFTKREVSGWIRSINPDCISIIDGMQRTTALLEAIDKNPNVLDTTIRLEIWAASKTNSLMYRMLVLNTGQVPWNLRRQIEVVFRSLLTEISKDVPRLEILNSDQSRRRVRGGQFQADDLVEMFLAFGSRKEKVNVRERIADEFTRLDFIEAASENQFSAFFTIAVETLVELDQRFDQFHEESVPLEGRFKHGRDLFSSQPACIGFMTALAIDVQGRPGTHRVPLEQSERVNTARSNAKNLSRHLESLTSEAVSEFLDFDTLNEILSIAPPGMSVGDFEREFFVKAFQVLIDEDFDLDSMTACWRAY